MLHRGLLQFPGLQGPLTPLQRVLEALTDVLETRHGQLRVRIVPVRVVEMLDEADHEAVNLLPRQHQRLARAYDPTDIQ